MNLALDIKPISYIKANAAETLRRLKESKNPVVITQNGESAAVLLDVESYQEMSDAFGLLKLLEASEAEARAGEAADAADALAGIKARLGIDA